MHAILMLMLLVLVLLRSPLSARKRCERIKVTCSIWIRQSAETRTLNRDRLAEISRLQGLALAIVVMVRSDPFTLHDFHLGDGFHQSTATGGSKYHIQSIATGWVTDQGPRRGVFKTKFLCVLVQIATVPPRAMVQKDAVIISKDREMSQISALLRVFDGDCGETQGKRSGQMQ